VLRSALRTRHTKNARQNSTDLSDEEELILEAEDQNIQPNNTPKEATQPPLGQILSTQSFTLPIEHDPALHVELTISEFIKMKTFPKKLFLIDEKLHQYTSILHFYSSERIFTKEAALKMVIKFSSKVLA
jgi:hypothetical protein